MEAIYTSKFCEEASRFKANLKESNNTKQGENIETANFSAFVYNMIKKKFKVSQQIAQVFLRNYLLFDRHV